MIETYTSNGLLIVTENQPHLHTVSMGMFIRSGTAFEGEANHGVSHFLEHMLFRGTPKYPTAKDFTQAVEKLGGDINAFTDYDVVCYHITCPAESAQKLLDLLLELFRGPKFEGLKRERGCILEEARSYLNSQGKCLDADTLLRETAWPESPLGRNIIGSEKTIQEMKLSQLKAHFRDFYVASNMALVITGNISHIKLPVIKLPEGDLHRSREIPGSGAFSPGESRFIKNTEAPQIQIVFGLPMVGVTDPKYPVFQVFATILNGGMSCRLEQKLREPGYAYEAGISMSLYATYGMFTMFSEVSKQNLHAATKAMVSLLKDLRNITPSEVAQAKKRLSWYLDAEQDSPMSRMLELGIEAIRGEAVFPEEFSSASSRRQKFDAVTLKQVRDFAKELASGPLHTVCIGNIDSSCKDPFKRAIVGW